MNLKIGIFGDWKFSISVARVDIFSQGDGGNHPELPGAAVHRRRRPPHTQTCAKGRLFGVSAVRPPFDILVHQAGPANFSINFSNFCVVLYVFSVDFTPPLPHCISQLSPWVGKCDPPFNIVGAVGAFPNSDDYKGIRRPGTLTTPSCPPVSGEVRPALQHCGRRGGVPQLRRLQGDTPARYTHPSLLSPREWGSATRPSTLWAPWGRSPTPTITRGYAGPVHSPLPPVPPWVESATRPSTLWAPWGRSPTPTITRGYAGPVHSPLPPVYRAGVSPCNRRSWGTPPRRPQCWRAGRTSPLTGGQEGGVSVPGRRIPL